jgi:putative hydrolase of the HAD superfamily
MELTGLKDATTRLIHSLGKNGIGVDYDQFVKVYREAVTQFLERASKDGKEGHNRFWISEALDKLGHEVVPDHPYIADAVESYFSAFIEHVRLIPGTMEMLETLKGEYRLGLLSNFTHSPAAMNIINVLGLSPYFEVMLISGDLGYRKPHPSVFRELVDGLGVPAEHIAYVGDDPQADVLGAHQAGLNPIWTTYVQDHDLVTVPGMLTIPPDGPLPEVPRISSWEDLFPLFGHGKP